MTPGLAGFVVSGDEATWDGVLDGTLAALREAFEVVASHGGTPGASRRTWFDTFDWRLYRNGLFLEYVATRRGGELFLTSGGARSGGIAQAVSGWRPARSYLAADLPHGPVTDKIAEVAFPRALLPLLTVASTTTVSRLLNNDGKTVARLLIERPVVEVRDAPHEALTHKALPPRIAIAEIRGYPGQARRAARIITLCPGIEAVPDTSGPMPAGAVSPNPVSPSTVPPSRVPGSAVPGTAVSADFGGRLLDDALRAVGRRACDYSNKVSAKITADMPAPRAAAKILLALLDALEVNVDGVLRDIDTEFLHDLRVAVRRTRAAIKLLGDVLGLGDADYDRFAAEFKWLGDLTTPVRDLDVHLLGFDAMASRLRAAKGDDLLAFRTFLEERRVREVRLLTRGLRSQRFTRLMTEWRVALNAVASPSGKGKGKGPERYGQGEGEGATARQVAVERTGQAFRKVTRRGAAITPDSPHESLHDLRKRCKELRYALEFFAPLHDKSAYTAVVGDLKKLQDCLGDFQDNEVQIEEVRAMAEAMLAAGAVFNGHTVPAGTLLAMGELTAGLAVSQQAARDIFEARFAGFAGPEGQRHMAVLLAGSETTRKRTERPLVAGRARGRA